MLWQTRAVRFLLSCALIGIGGCGLVSSLSVQATPVPGRFIIQDLAGLVQSAEIILVGEITESKPGRLAGEGEARLQFKDFIVTNELTLMGEEVSDTIVVEQVDMSDTTYSSIGRPYKTGERYMLFLIGGEPGLHVTVQQGNYSIKDNTLVAMQIGPIADELNGKTEQEVIESVKAAIIASQ